MIVTIRDFYYDVLLEKEINFAIKDNQAPNMVEIIEGISERLAPIVESDGTIIEAYPLTNSSQFEVEEGELASASKINQTLTNLHNDLSAVYRTFVYQGALVTSFFDDLTQRMLSFKNQADLYREATSNSLALAGNVEGYLDFVADDFSTTDSIDLANTDTEVNLTSGTLLLKQTYIDRFPAEEVMIDSDVTFSVITHDFFISSTIMPGLELINPFLANDKTWIQQISMSRSVEKVDSELVFKLVNDSLYFNKIILEPVASSRGDFVTVVLEYSSDALNWKKIQGLVSTQLSRATVFSFIAIQANYFKIKFSKIGFDEYINDTYVYQVGLSSVEIFSTTQFKSTLSLEGTMYSVPLSPSSGKEFNKLALSVCEIIPDQTSIQYEIAALTSSVLDEYLDGTKTLDDLIFTPIDPIERVEKLYPSSIDYGALSPETGFTSPPVQKDDTISFFNEGDYDIAIDYVVQPEEVLDYLRVFRNKGDNTVADTAGTPNKISGIDTGWSFDGQYYTTNFYVDADKELDLGETSASLDGRQVIGRTTFLQGYHLFTTSKNFFRPIDPTTITTETDTVDLIYPYNHKYLIEGVKDTLYGVDLTTYVGGKTKKEIIDPDGVYGGVLLYAEKTCDFVPTFDFTQVAKFDNLDIFSIAPQINTGTPYVIVKDGGRLNQPELFAIISTSKKSNVSLSKAVIIKIVLKSGRFDITPQVDEFSIRLTV